MLTLICGSVIALSLPAGAGLDEPMHVARVEQISEGKFLPVRVSSEGLDTTLVSPSSDEYDLYGGETDTALYELMVTGNLSFYDEDGHQLYDFPTWDDPALASDGVMGEASVTWLFPNTAVNSPLSYLPQVVGYLLATLFSAGPLIVILTMRLCGVLAYAVGSLLCILLLPVGRRLFGLVAVLPQSVAASAVVSADSMSFVFASILVASIVRMLWCESVGRGTWVALAISTLCLCLAKTTYVPFGLLLPMLPLLRRDFRTPRRLVVVGVIGTVSLLAFVLWYLRVAGVNTGVMWSSKIEPDEQLRLVLQDPCAFLGAALSTLLKTDVLALSSATPYSGNVSSASWIVVIALLLAFAPEVLELERRRVDGRVSVGLAAGLAALSALIVLLIYLAMYLQFTPLGNEVVKGVQTRYFTPLVFPMLLALALLLRPRHPEGTNLAPARLDGGDPSDGNRTFVSYPLLPTILGLVLVAALTTTTCLLAVHVM